MECTPGIIVWPSADLLSLIDALRGKSHAHTIISFMVYQVSYQVLWTIWLLRNEILFSPGRMGTFDLLWVLLEITDSIFCICEEAGPGCKLTRLLMARR